MEKKKNIITLCFICLATSLFTIDMGIITISFSEIENFFSTTNSVTSWVLTVFSISSAIGMFFIVVGSLTLHSSQFNSQTKLLINYNYLNNKNLLYILIVSLIWSLTPVLDKECLKYTGVYLHGFLQSCCL